jgi:galactofuranose transport system ATP-binding protein
VLRLSHKVAVMRDRQLVTELANDDSLDADRIMRVIAGGVEQKDGTRHE